MPRRTRAFVDADVLFAGSASPSTHSASNVVLRMGEMTLLNCITSQQVITVVERSLAEKLPVKLPEFRLIVGRSLGVVADPTPTDFAPHIGQADPKDLPILVAALRENCSHLLTFNVRHFAPPAGCITVQRPGVFLLDVRHQLSTLRGTERWIETEGD